MQHYSDVLSMYSDLKETSIFAKSALLFVKAVDGHFYMLVIAIFEVDYN